MFLNALKAQQKTWDKQILLNFEMSGIDRCEWPWPSRCGSTFGVAPAHRKKRRFIGWDMEEYLTTAYLCSKHHFYAEHGDSKHRGTHRRMFRIITAVINRRGT